MNDWDSTETLDALIRLWNSVGLPLVLAVIVAAGVRGRGVGADRRRTIAVLGLVHLALAAWSLKVVVAEGWLYRTVGGFASNPVTGFAGSALAMLIDVPTGLALGRVWRPVRWWAIVVNLVRTAFAAFMVRELWRFGGTVNLAEWPSYVANWGAPPLLLAILLLPATGRAFRRPTEAEPSTRVSALDMLIAIVARWLLAVAASVAVVDSLDWLCRTFLLGEASAG